MLKYCYKQIRACIYLIGDYIGWPKIVLLISAVVFCVTIYLKGTHNIIEISSIFVAVLAAIFGLYKTEPKDRISGTFTARVQQISKDEYLKRLGVEETSLVRAITDNVLQIHFEMNIANIGNSLVHMGLRDTEAKNETIQFGIIHFGNVSVPMRFQLDLDTTFILTKGLSNSYYYDSWYFESTPDLENIKIEVFTKTGKSVYLKPAKNGTTLVLATI